MCGRFTLKTPPDQWSQLLLPMIDSAALLVDWRPRYNIAPTQDILAIASNEGGGRRADYFRWGLVPSWATDLSIGNRMINARSETLTEKKSFLVPLQKRRCLIVADGYYEWQKLGGKNKQPHWIAPRSGGVIQFAGLWELNTKAAGHPIQSCTIITTAANESLSSILDRMPAILMDDAAQQWLDLSCDANEAAKLLGPVEKGFLEARNVSTHVNNARNEDEACLQEMDL